VGLFAYLPYALGAITPYLKADFVLSDLLVGLNSSAFALGLIVSGLVGDRIATLAAAFVMGLCGGLMLESPTGRNPLVFRRRL